MRQFEVMKKLVLPLLIGLLLTGCSQTTDPTSTVSQDMQIMSRDYCPDLLPSLDSLNKALYRAEQDDDFDGLRAVTRAAEHIVTQVEIARRQGLDLEADEASWMNGLDASAQALLLLMEADPDEFTEEELDEYVSRISYWFDQAYLECEEFQT